MDKTINKNSCRVCLQNACELEDLYDSMNTDLLSKLKTFAQLGKEEELPKSKLPNRICEKCIPSLKVAYDFKTLCEKSDLILKKVFSDNIIEIKTEPTDQIEEIDVSKVKRDDDWDMEIDMDIVVKKEVKKKPGPKKDEYIIFCDKCHRIFDDKSTRLKHKRKCDGKGNEKESEKESSDEDTGEVVGWDKKSVADDEDDDDVQGGWDARSVRDDSEDEEDEVKEKDEITPAEKKDDDDDDDDDADADADADSDDDDNYQYEPQVQVRVFDSDNPLECEKCNRTFTNKSGFTKHRTKCIKPGEEATDDRALKSYDCHVCKKIFQGFNTLRRHQTDAHACEPSPENVEKYRLERIEIKANNIYSTCTLCFKSFASVAGLTRHTKTKHDTGKFVCEVCNNDFYTQHQLNKHKLSHTTERNFPCDLCKKAFRTPAHLKKHQKTHMSFEDRNNSERVKKYLCICCGKILYTYTGYQFHLKIHTDEKDFSCEICGKRFRKKAHLRKHKENVHVEGRPFNCSICQMSFKLKTHLKAHRKTHTVEKKFFCDICGASMKHKESLKHHVRNIHMGIRDHKCDLCDEAFYSNSWLNKHKANKH